MALANAIFLISGCLPRDNSGNDATEFYCTATDSDRGIHGIRVTFPSCTTYPSTCGQYRTTENGIDYYPTILFVPGNNIGVDVKGRANMDGMQADMDAAIAKGFAAATINYRRDSGMNGIADDIACAVRYLKQRPANAESQRIDANRVGVMAHSLASIGTWQLAAGIEPSETKQELEGINPLPEDSIPILYSDLYNGQSSLPAAVVISNGGADPMSILTNGVALHNIENGITQTDTELPCNYNMAFVLAYKYPVKPSRTCDINGLTPRFTGIERYNAPYWMDNAPSDRRTRGATARPVLIVNARNDATMKPINSFVAQSHFNQPQLARPYTPLVQLDDDHPYTKFNPDFRKIFMLFFEAALANNGDPSTIDYCKDITQPPGNTSGSPACRLNPTN